ncbi:hypothetical protein SAMN05444008_11862 [Cnuella takakiae]|uniref:DUF5362 domain-containing protein n=1 Tax=Cnuella takakiae TaxID=1302690 RepID=A0A1M5H7J0_9BACT|nr:DUF5362 family protein [Cnuella takakiae]OLY91084.1 hypothetical protein BUE76_03585 [Cnuella takakiae]SHG11878.1 hypothetical protein SAMN05444008_11862 [Cnuella takakiae]
MEPLKPQQPIYLNDESRSYLLETARWGRFLAIVGFVMLGLGVLAAIIIGLVMATQLAPFTNATFTGSILPVVFPMVYALLAALYFFPCRNLYRFANKTKTALVVNDQETLTQAFANLKSLFKFVGVLTMVLLGFYALSFVFGALIFTVFQ